MRLQITKAFPRAGQLEAQTEDRQIERLFAWLTRNGIGRKFGSLPIGWYQAHQIAAINIIQDAGGDVVRVKHGTIQTLRDSKWQPVMSCIDAFQKADDYVRTH